MKNLKSHGVGCEGGNLGSPGSEVRQTLKDIVLFGVGATCLLVIGGVDSGAPPKFLEFGKQQGLLLPCYLAINTEESYLLLT
jgi:hypothetical protein